MRIYVIFIQNVIHIVLNHIISVVDQSTISSILLTDRTLLLGKCRFVLEKYNVTMTEVYCVCYANCPWRPPTDFEKEMKKEFGRRVIQTGFYRMIRDRSLNMGGGGRRIFRGGPLIFSQA